MAVLMWFALRALDVWNSVPVRPVKVVVVRLAIQAVSEEDAPADIAVSRCRQPCITQSSDNTHAP